MPLSTGDKLGPYEILARLGAGGMGGVYRARDSKLNRDVAIKVLPATLANDSEYMARFEREARRRYPCACRGPGKIPAVKRLRGTQVEFLAWDTLSLRPRLSRRKCGALGFRLEHRELALHQ